MNKELNNIIYTAKDIEQYFAGGMSPVQMHAMEKAALDDPFLSDAMEGYEIMQGKEWKAHLYDLHQRLEERSSMAKVVPMQQAPARKWWKIAAAIFIIGSGTTLTWMLTKDKSSTELKPEVVKAITTTPDSSNTASTVPLPVSTSPEKEKPVLPVPVKPLTAKTAEPNKDLVTTSNPAVNTNSDDVLKQVKPQTTGIVKSEVPVMNTDSVKSKTLLSTPPPLVNNNVAAADKDNNGNLTNAARADAEKKRLNSTATNALVKTPPLNRSFSAQVLGPDNTPLPFSNISIKSENFGTYADVKGNFRLVSSDSILVVEVRSVGYLPKTYTLRSSQGVTGNQAQNKIMLNEDEIAYKEKAFAKEKLTSKPVSRKATLIKDSVVNVEPADGWDNYSTYIANNIELPDEVLKNDQHGEIGISFDVKADGTITNLKIDPSQCTNCEEITKRLIEQGPQWKVKKGKKASAKVKLQF
jgi:hypothetical protein